MIRLIIGVFFGGMLMSACSSGDGKKPIEKEDITVFDHGVIAEVSTEFEAEGCEVLLILREMKKGTVLLPINLEDKYKVHGLKLLITYGNSRMMESECQMGRPIKIEKIKIVE